MASGSFPAAVRKLVAARAREKCELCGRPLAGIPASIHHRKPRGMGGTKDPSISGVANALLLCGTGTTGCHGFVERNRRDAVMNGWLVPRHGPPPDEVPFTDREGGTWLLESDGNKRLLGYTLG